MCVCVLVCLTVSIVSRQVFCYEGKHMSGFKDSFGVSDGAIRHFSIVSFPHTFCVIQPF